MDPHLLQTLEQGVKATIWFTADVTVIRENFKPWTTNLLLERNKLNPCTPRTIANLILININFLFELRVWQVGSVVSNNPHLGDH